jgi:NTE family protein
MPFRSGNRVAASMVDGQKLGLAFQGGSFLAGAIGTGVVAALVRAGEFDRATAFSGTSAGALVAAMCWRHKLENQADGLPWDLFRQWMANANGLVPNVHVGTFLKLVDRWLLLNPLYFWGKELFVIPVMQRLFEDWIIAHVQPEACMRVLFDRHLRWDDASRPADWRRQAAERYRDNADRLWLAIGTAEIRTGRVVTIDDADLFEALLEAYATALRRGLDAAAARQQAVSAAGRYMTLALMTSGSLDSVNGITRIDTVDGIDNLDRLHPGDYLDGAYSQNPPIAPLTKAGVDEIWMVEIFPERCDGRLDNNEKREDRKEELLQNAPVQHQYQFINNLNFWIKTGRLRELDQQEQAALEHRLRVDSTFRRELIELFEKTEPHAGTGRDESELIEAIGAKVRKPYKTIRTRTIALPAELQPLTDAARIINSPLFLWLMMYRGLRNTYRFLAHLDDR